MANERDDEQFGEKKEFGQDRQQPTGQQGQQPEFGQQGQQPEFGQQGQQPELGQQGQQPTGQQGQQSEFGQQGQSSSGQTEPGRSGDTETLSTDRGFGQGAGGGQSGSGQPGQGGSEGTGGFVGSQGTGSDEYLREEGSTGGSDFASQGQGATEGATDKPDEDIETGQRQNRDSDIEGGSGNI